MTTEIQEVEVQEVQPESAKRVETMMKASNMFKVREQLDEIQTLSVENDRRKATVIKADDKDEVVEHLESATEGKDYDAIEALTIDEVNEIFTLNGEPIELIIPYEDAAQQAAQRKDYLIYLKESKAAADEMEEKMKELEQVYAEFEDEVKNIMVEHGDYVTFYRNYLVETMEAQTDPGAKAAYGEMIEAYDNSITLSNIIAHYKSMSPYNTMQEYRRGGLAQNVYGKYIKAAERLGVKTDISKLSGIEKNLPEKYQPYVDLFLYTVIKYIGYRKNVTKHVDGVFLSSLLMNLRPVQQPLRLQHATDRTKENTETLKNAIMQVLDIFIDYDKSL